MLIKPDALERGLVGRIVSRIEEKGLRIVGMKIMKADRGLAERHYSAHRGKDFYEPLLRFITSAPLVATVVEGLNAVEVVRSLVGATDCKKAAPGTIRGDFGMSKRYNLVHGSDSAEAAATEIGLFFEPAELLEYELRGYPWIYDVSGGEVV